jgi:hypothetical protein
MQFKASLVTIFRWYLLFVGRRKSTYPGKLGIRSRTKVGLQPGDSAGLPAGVTSVDHQVASGKKTARIRCEEYYGWGYLLCLSDPAHGRELHPDFVPIASNLILWCHWGVDVAWRNAVDADSPFRPFARERLRQHDHAGFGRIVRGLGLGSV